MRLLGFALISGALALPSCGGPSEPTKTSSDAQAISTKGIDDARVEPPGSAPSQAHGIPELVVVTVRSNGSLIKNIETLEHVIADTPKNGQERPGLMRRLAEAYVELENAMLRDKIDLSIKADEL